MSIVSLEDEPNEKSLNKKSKIDENEDDSIQVVYSNIVHRYDNSDSDDEVMFLCEVPQEESKESVDSQESSPALSSKKTSPRKSGNTAKEKIDVIVLWID